MAHSFSYFSVPTAWQDGALESNEHGGNPSRDSLDYHLAALSLDFPASPFQEQHQLDHDAHAVLPQFDVVNEFDLEFQEDVSVNDFDVEPAMDNNVDISVDDFDVEHAMDNNVDISVDDFDLEPAMDNNVDISVDDFDVEPAMDNNVDISVDDFNVEPAIDHVIANSGASLGLQPHPSLEEQPKLSGTEFTNKTRMRWTQPLHDLFVEAVAELEGPDRATPKSILILMGVEGITMCQVKSHLQKYRLARLEAQFQEGKK
ncbi:Myb domain plants domain-containing protein [Dioscorea alata]|uniref:Myb domain plants domain-containing protein n=1 Tax=Dioscorea alata TaxID=55571 RepID=A0ACB7U4V9_DIOAL|nr:Myb domain plants domain-containing protein [Dioscorea alata]